MKKITKTLTASVLAVAASAGVFTTIPVDHIAYAENTNQVASGDVISATKLPTDGTVGRPVVIPVATAKSLANVETGNAVTITVTRPDGRAQQVTENKTGDPATLENWSFTPIMAGTYKLQYQVTNTTSNVTTLSEVFHIKVTADSYEMTIDQNSDVILPSMVDTNKDRFDGGVIKSVVLPNPTVKNEAGYVVFENGAPNKAFARYAELPGLISAASGEEKTALEEEYNKLIETFEEYDIENEDVTFYAGGKVEIEVTTESKTLSSVATDDKALTKSGNNYSFVPEQGTNVIHYVYKAADNTNLQSLTKTIVGSNTYNHKTIKLGWTAANRPTSAKLNERVNLPLASGFNKADANSVVAVKTIISVKEVGGDGKELVERDAEGYFFIPTKSGADYEITYNAEDYYGNKGTAYSYTIEDVKDGSAPTMYIVEAFDYGTTAEAIYEMQNAEHMIPTKVGRKQTTQIVFPAFFGEDKVVSYNNLKFYRSITSNEISGSIGLIDANLVLQSGENIADMTQAEKASHAASIKLDELNDDGTKKYPAGDYTITYTIRDGNGYSASKSFTFTIVEDFADTEAPTITYGDQFPTLVNDGQEVRIVKPTISDTTDATPKVNYYVLAGGSSVEVFEVDGYITFNMSDEIETGVASIYDKAITVEGGNKIAIKTVAVDDYGKTAEKVEYISVRNAKDNTPITVRTSVADDFKSEVLPTITNTYRQGSVVTVAGVTFEDNDPNLTIMVTVRDDQGNKVTGIKSIGNIERETTGGVTRYTHPGIQFSSSKAVSYTVTYTAVDAGNNIVAYTVKLPTLSDSEKPQITGVTSGKVYEIELGKKLDLGRVVVLDNVDTNLTPTLTCEAHPEYVNGTIFAPTEVGTYTVVYSAVDSKGNDADTVSVEVVVKDKTAPELNIVNKEKYGTYMMSQSSVTNAKDFVAIELPSFSVEEETYDFGLDAGALNMYANGTIKIAAPNGNTYTTDNTDSDYLISYDEEKKVYSFVPTTKGTYTVTYSAVDASGNKAEDYVITVMVGDTVLPTIGYKGDLSANLKVGDKIVLDEAKVSITDNIPAEEGKTFEPTSITIEDAAGNVLKYDYTDDEETLRKYVFETAGSYTLTIVGRDAAGNSNSYSYKFNVTSDASSSSIKDNVTGVVLIVVSLLILAGVIIYFAKGKKKVSVKKTVKKIEKKESTEDSQD